MGKLRRQSKKAGLAPGTLVFTGAEKTDKVTIHVLDYDEKDFKEIQVENIEDIMPLKETDTVTWVDILGLQDISVIEKLGQIFSIHPLVLEDVVHPIQRPKMEEFGTYIFFVLRMFYFDNENIVEEQISIILGENYVITFQERPGDVFNPVRERIRSGTFRIRKSKSDHLLYALIDAIVDNYFIILEKIGDTTEDIEDDLLANPSQDTLLEIQGLKRKIITLRRAIWPLREVMHGLDRTESDLMKPATKIYVRDVYDHTNQVIDTIENYREILSSMLDIYLSSLSNSMNQVMKTLTIIATIFMPLTFVAGIYGMNFEYMPELKWKFGYLFLWVIIFIISLIMYAYFKRKKWL
ncbi:MAG: magnesium and cobalt transport protein CorA [Acidobacteria bacterium CG_4_9_14_3_um_filter_49_7]|nr:MAG: magnesium and cobalt transport protein CorA [Acidobacteria bacterium CG_4_9_14_3_um_filter_49_7]